MWRWLETFPYWGFYYLIYLVVLGIQLGENFPPQDSEKWAIAFAVSAGFAFTFTLVIELGVRVMLLIPKAVHDILEKGRVEERRALLDSLVKHQDISEQRRKEIEAERKEK